LEVLWRIKIQSVHIPAAIVQFKAEIHFAVSNVVSKVPLENRASAAIRAVAIIKHFG
jgi:predicted aconitase with swiveling domain